MKLKRLAAAAKPFAALLGISAEEPNDDHRDDPEPPTEAEKKDWEAKSGKDEERKREDDESDGEYATRMRKMDAEEKAKAEQENTGEEDDDESEGMKAARLDERARCSQIVTYGHKHGMIGQAITLASSTNLTAAQAVAVMAASKRDSAAAPARSPSQTLSDRMAGVSVPRVGAEAPTQTLDPNDPQAVAKATAAAILKAAAKARGEKMA